MQRRAWRLAAIAWCLVGAPVVGAHPPSAGTAAARGQVEGRQVPRPGDTAAGVTPADDDAGLATSDAPLAVAALVAPLEGRSVRVYAQAVAGPRTPAVTEMRAALIGFGGRVAATFRLDPAPLAAGDPRAGRVFCGVAEVAPGGYGLEVVAVGPSGRVGTIEKRIDARPHRLGDLAHSDLLVGIRPGPGQAFRPLPRPAVDREVLIGLEVASGTVEATPEVDITFEIAGAVEGEPLVEHPVTARAGERPSLVVASLQVDLLPAGEYVARARIRVPGAEPAVLTRRFAVVTLPADAGATRPRVDPTSMARPPVAPFSKERALEPRALSPFLDYLAREYPQGERGRALLARAREGAFERPGRAADDRDALAYAMVGGLAALRDGATDACIRAFSEAIDRADGFTGLAVFQGDCYAATGHDLDAIAAWQMALTAGVGEPVIYEQLVDALLRVGRPEEALDTLAEADLRWADRRGFDARRGLALALLDRHQEAVPLLEAAAADPAADRELLFYVMQAIYVGRVSGWLEPSEALSKRFDTYLERYTAAAGAQAALAKTWRRAVQEP